MGKVKKTYEARQAESGLKVGDRVRVTRVPPHTWGKGVYRGNIPDSIVEGEWTITAVHADSIGVGAITAATEWWVPYFILEKIEDSPAAYLRDAVKRDIQVGDLVTVVRKAGNYEGGWGNTWPSDMDSMIGGTSKVDYIHDTFGVRLAGGGYFFPHFVLERPHPEVGDTVRVLQSIKGAPFTAHTAGEVHKVISAMTDDTVQLENGLWYVKHHLAVIDLEKKKKEESEVQSYSFKVSDAADIDVERIVRESNFPEVLLVELDRKAMVAIRQDILDLPIRGASVLREKIHSGWGCRVWPFPVASGASIEGYRGYSLLKDALPGTISDLEALRAAIGPARAAAAAKPKIKVKVRTF